MFGFYLLYPSYMIFNIIWQAEEILKILVRLYTHVRKNIFLWKKLGFLHDFFLFLVRLIFDVKRKNSVENLLNNLLKNIFT